MHWISVIFYGRYLSKNKPGIRKHDIMNISAKLPTPGALLLLFREREREGVQKDKSRARGCFAMISMRSLGSSLAPPGHRRSHDRPTIKYTRTGPTESSRAGTNTFKSKQFQ